MDFEPLFLPLPRFEKQAYANLSLNAADWVHDITKMVYEKMPYVTQFPTKIKLDRVDEQRGYGYGSIEVGGKINIPLIIKNFELQAMDVMIQDGKFFPLSERRLEEALFNPEVFGKPVDMSGQDQSIYTSNYPPHSGKYTYASIRLLDKLSSKITKESQQNFLKTLTDKSIFAAYKASGTLNVVKTAAELKVREHVDAAKILPCNYMQIEKIAEDKFIFRAASDYMYDPKEVELDRKTLFAKFGAEVGKLVLDKGSYTTIQGTRPYRPQIVEELDGEKAKKITKSGKYQVRDLTGDKRTGWVYPNVVDFDLKKLDDKLFTDGLAYSLQGSIAGIGSSGMTDSDKDHPPLADLSIGKTGCFLISRDGTDVCTVPVTITSPVFDQGTHIRFEVSDHFGRAFIIEVTSGVKSITKSKTQYNVYTLPADVKFIKVGRNSIRLVDNPSDFASEDRAEKIAKEKDVVVVSSDDGNVFNLAGNNLKEVANDARGVGETKAKWHLVSLGLDEQTADQALKRARKNGRTKIVDTKPLITQAEKQAQVLSERVVPLLNKVSNLRQDLIKVASVLDDEQVVDKVLALNFLTPENTQTFVEYLPALEDAASKLAQILIAIRVGMKRIPETAARNAMMGLEAVIAGLRGMEALGNVGTPEGAL